MTDKLLSRKELSEIVGLGKTAIYAAIKRGTLPPPIKISPMVARWRLSEVERFLENCPRGGT